MRATAAWVGQFRESCIAGSNYRENRRERIVTIFDANWNRELVKDIIYKLVGKSICCDTKTGHMTKESIKIKLRILFFLDILKRK